MLKRLRVFQSSVSTGTYQIMLSEIVTLGASKTPSYVCFANAHMLVEASRNSSFNEVVKGADIVAPDGKPVSILMRHTYSIKQDRVCGMDIFPDLLGACESMGLSVFFYGSTEDVLNKICSKAIIEYPRLKINGFHSPPFRKLTKQEEVTINKKILEAEPNFILVSLGCPKQEIWMRNNKDKFSACMLGLGQAFLTYADLEKRLPKWARELALEWAYRLFLEPKRLWRRYLVGNTIFIFFILKYHGFGKSKKLAK